MGSKRLASECYLDSSHQLMVPPQLPSQVTGDPSQSSSVSGVFLQGDGQSQTPPSSQLNPSLGSSSNSVSGTGWSNLGPSSADMYRSLNSSNSGPSVGASSLVTDANSALSGGAHLRRSSSINTESYMRLPASPLSFSSNNIGISESSVMDGSSVVQQNSQQDQNPQKIQQRQQQQQQQQEGASSSSSQLTSQTGKITLQMSQEPHLLLPMQKKPRLDISQGDILQQQIFQQVLQRQGSFQPEGQNPWLQALLQRQRLLQQQHLHHQQILQSMPHMQQQQQVRQQLQHGQHPASGMKQPLNTGICARRLMQYMYHQRQRPADNSISYWRKFVAEYYASHAKKRWCLSLYDTVGHNSLGVFPQAAMLNTWHCDICGTKSGRGFEATVDILPRLSKIEFDIGVIDELLFADVPQEFRFSSGLMMLEYGKAIQESVYEQLRVVREGQLRIIFTPDLKILSWEFCARRHEELLPRRLLAPQVNQLAQVAQKYLTTSTESGSAGVSPQDLQTICNKFTTASCQLTRNLDLQLVNDLGFSKRYIRCLQISDVVSGMTDLINFSLKCKIGPIESLKEYSRQAAAIKLQIPRMQEIEHLPNVQGVSADQTTLNKIISMRPGLSSHLNDHRDSSAMNHCAQTVAALSYQNMLRQSSMDSNLNSFKTEAPYSFNGPNLLQSLPFQGPDSQILGSIPNATVNGLSGPDQWPSPLLKQNQQSSLANQHSQQRVIQQTLQEISTKGGMRQLPPCGQNANRNAAGDISSTVNGEGSLPLGTATGVAEFSDKTTNAPDTVADPAPCGTNSFKTATNNSAVAGGNGSRQDVLEDPHFVELLQDMPCEFGEWDF